MKKKLFILALILSFFNVLMPELSVLRAEGTSSTTTNELPSNVFLQKEKRSLGADYGQAMLPSKQTISSYSADNPWEGEGGGWDDKPNTGGTGNGGNVAGPIGDISLPIVFSILVLYLGYRRFSTSRRRNDI